MNPWTICYFSGTGGTKRIAEEMKDKMGKGTKWYSLDAPIPIERIAKRLRKTKRLVLLYPVHATDAPLPVYHFLTQLRHILPDLSSTKVAVVSVSAGGDMWPNTSCRDRVKERLERLGGQVVHESMMVMPSNWLVETNVQASLWLMRSLPKAVDQVCQNLMASESSLDQVAHGQELASNVGKDTDYETIEAKHKKAKKQPWLARQEKHNARRFGKQLKTNDQCTSCGWCERSCPALNIQLDPEGKPVFHDRCMQCMRCVYGCPEQAIVSRSKQVLKNGYDLAALEQWGQNVTLVSIDACTKGAIWKGVRAYLHQVNDPVPSE